MSDGWRPAPQGARIRPFASGGFQACQGDDEALVAWGMTQDTALHQLAIALAERAKARARAARQRAEVLA